MSSKLPPARRDPDAATAQEEEVRFTLRAAGYLFSLVDEARLRRPGKISRNTWILEAVTEKLKRERDGG